MCCWDTGRGRLAAWADCRWIDWWTILTLLACRTYVVHWWDSHHHKGPTSPWNRAAVCRSAWQALTINCGSLWPKMQLRNLLLHEQPPDVKENDGIVLTELHLEQEAESESDADDQNASDIWQGKGLKRRNQLVKFLSKKLIPSRLLPYYCILLHCSIHYYALTTRCFASFVCLQVISLM